ncbi:aldo/keto reductase [Neptunicella marina]|uniref:Aldo/keto reductase n=1 Tax=Neptunicella marina TaxID=2125989 RepID=A0A8J6M006_9ALTE|nr:aldo/keto reductase [Neptunicella marina]MBC3764557.1 aldo/keto reductase [Neptunicella marina]
MKQRQLGHSGFDVSEVGLGCWQLGGDFGVDFDDKQAFAILQTAVDKGVTFFDTADVYGAGKSEKFIGDFLKQSSASIRVATKFGRGGDVFPDNYTEDALRQAIAASCERLGVEQLDLLQLHCVPVDVLKQGDIFNWLRKVQDEGLIRYFGASVESVEEALICLEQDGLQSLQVIFNIFRQKLVNELLPKAQQKGVGIIVRLPLASGLLSGKFKTGTTFSTTDHRNFNQNGECFNVGETFAGLPFAKGVELADELKGLLPQDISMAQASLRWILDHPAVTTIIPGASSVKQVADNAAIADLAPLPESTHQQLAAFYQHKVQSHIRGPY